MYNWELITSIYGLKPDLRAGTGFPFLYETKKETCAEIDEQHEGFYAHADDVFIKQYESLRHCVLFILIEE